VNSELAFSHDSKLTYRAAPAQEVLEYEIRKFHGGFHSDLSIYQGPPSDELDQAWEDLYNCEKGNIPVTD
jgi:hypothetical protein